MIASAVTMSHGKSSWRLWITRGNAKRSVAQTTITRPRRDEVISEKTCKMGQKANNSSHLKHSCTGVRLNCHRVVDRCCRRPWIMAISSYLTDSRCLFSDLQGSEKGNKS